jgi:glycolate oxidase iron-sulfur subunit
VHDGQAAAAEPLARRNVAAFRDHAVVLNNSAGCGCALKEYGHLLGSEEARDFARRCRDVSEFLHEQGLVATPRPFPHTVAYDDPCHLCHGQGVRKPPRMLLGQVPGLTYVQHHDPESCCGSAGIYNLVHPELAWQIGEAKAKALVASGAQVVATGNPGCMLQIRAHLQALGSPMRVVHPIELLVP